jgi:hypothetical protein
MAAATQSTVLRYPYEAITEKTDYLQINIVEYSGTEKLIEEAGFGTNQSSFDVANIAGNTLKPKQLVEGGTILLPMPSNIEDSNSVSYDGDTLNGLVAQGLDIASTLMGGSIFDKNERDRIGQEMIKKVEGLLTDPGTKDVVMKSLAASAINVFGSNVTPNQLFARSQGKILNPNMELLFNNVTLRTFRFSFKMTPRDEIESLQIKSIIRSFKRNMAAQTDTSSNLFIKTPNIFELEYKKGNKPHPFLHRFKQCALSDMSVNYTGENVYATYNDGTPISVILNLTFKELVPIYQSDYDKDIFGNDVSETGLTYGVNGNEQKDTEGVGY